MEGEKRKDIVYRPWVGMELNGAGTKWRHLVATLSLLDERETSEMEPANSKITWNFENGVRVEKSLEMYRSILHVDLRTIIKSQKNGKICDSLISFFETWQYRFVYKKHLFQRKNNCIFKFLCYFTVSRAESIESKLFHFYYFFIPAKDIIKIISIIPRNIADLEFFVAWIFLFCALSSRLEILTGLWPHHAAAAMIQSFSRFLR